MEPKPRLNPLGSNGIFLLLLVAVGTGGLYRQLAALYDAADSRLALPPSAESVSQTGAGRSPKRREDAGLFERALEVGLLRMDEAGRLAPAPADLPLQQRWAKEHPDLLVPLGNGPDWRQGFWDDQISRIHRALHFSASGRYVLQEVEWFNAQRPGSAIQWQKGRLIWRDRR